MATMLRWSPFQDHESMERQMRRVFEGIGFAPVLLPAADIYETEDEFVVELEVPGYEEKELGIEVFDHTVSVKGERKEAKEEKDKAFHLRESQSQSKSRAEISLLFERVIVGVDSSPASAEAARQAALLSDPEGTVTLLAAWSVPAPTLGLVSPDLSQEIEATT
jgi:HSP20 family molecular chaperone IbpA